MNDPYAASIGLIRDVREDGTLWLVYKPEAKQLYQPIIAERLGSESWRACLDREISWALQLVSGRDYIISSMARLHYVTEITRPGDEYPAPFTIEFYVVDWYGKFARPIIADDPRCRWVTTAQLLAGQFDEDATIDPVSVQLLNRSQILIGC